MLMMLSAYLEIFHSIVHKLLETVFFEAGLFIKFNRKFTLEGLSMFGSCLFPPATLASSHKELHIRLIGRLVILVPGCINGCDVLAGM